MKTFHGSIKGCLVLNVLLVILTLLLMCCLLAPKIFDIICAYTLFIRCFSVEWFIFLVLNIQFKKTDVLSALVLLMVLLL
jgi:hypothetical protein